MICTPPLKVSVKMTALIGFLFTVFVGASPLSAADEPPAKDKFTLTIEGEITPELAPVVGQFTTTFYQTYPALLKRFENPEKPAARQVRLIFDPKLKIPAHCQGAVITISVPWIQQHPEDLGMLLNPGHANRDHSPLTMRGNFELRIKNQPHLPRGWLVGILKPFQ